MENTGNVMFSDDLPQWYVALGERWLGPLTASDVYERIMRGELSWAHYVWRQGFQGWKRVCDTEAFLAAVPSAPPPGILDDVRETARPGVKKGKRAATPPAPPPPIEPEKREWFLHYNSSQYGPFGGSEVKRFLAIGKIHGRVYAWKDGMGTWERLEKIPPFKSDSAASEKAYAARIAQKKTQPRPAGFHPSYGTDVPEPTAILGTKAEQRRAPRRPIVARILMAKGAQVIMGVCRDISVGGMQVLTDHIPGPTGTRIKLNVSPPDTSSRDIEPFVAEGVVVRILEDGRGFSFRFDRLPDATLRSIEKYFAAE